MVGEMRHGGLLQNHCWGTEWDVRGEGGGVNGHWDSVSAGVDEDASAALSVQVVTVKGSVLVIDAGMQVKTCRRQRYVGTSDC